MRTVFAPLTAPTTWRRWAYLILGGALLMPYMMAGEVVASLVRRAGTVGDPLASAQVAIFLAVLPVVAATGLVLPLRGLESSAARELVTSAVEAPGTALRSWPQRWRCACWFTLHLAVGGIVSGLSLALPPFAVWLWTLPFYGDSRGMMDAASDLAPGWATAWTIPAGIVVLLGLVYLVAGTGALLARLAPTLLGPTASERLAALQRHAGQLAERNRLARELHDSVGHSLSVVTLQAAAAARTLDGDRHFARKALGAIEEAARGALDDLDHVLGLLRDERGATRAPQPTLRDLDALLEGARMAGTQVQAHVDADLDVVPSAVSREAYRIVQEGLTNAARHAGCAPVTVRVELREGVLVLELTNPLGPRTTGRDGGGHGLVGIRERVAVLRGEAWAAVEGDVWRVRVRLPL